MKGLNVTSNLFSDRLAPAAYILGMISGIVLMIVLDMMALNLMQ